MIFVLWANTERTEWTFLESRGSESAQGRLKMDDHQLVWSVEASSYNEAMASYHRYMGWEPYLPMPRPDGTHANEDFLGFDEMRRLALVRQIAWSGGIQQEIAESVVGGYMEEKAALPYVVVDGERTDWSTAADAIFERLAAEGIVPEPLSDDDYGETPWGALKGLVSLTDIGCGHTDTVQVNGDGAGRIWFVSADGNVRPGARDFCKLIETWVDEAIADFTAVAGLIQTCDSAEEIDRRGQDLIEARYRTRDYMISILGTPKPEEVFVRRNRPEFHLTTLARRSKMQDPWYEEVFADWKAQSQ